MTQHHSKKRWNKKLKMRLGIVGACLLILITGVIVNQFVLKPRDEQRKVIYEGEEEIGSVEDSLINIPKDAKSEVCDKISAQSVEKAVKQQITQARVSIPTTKSAEGSVSACTYITARVEENDRISHVVITTRQLKDEAAAKKSFEILNRIPSKDSKKLNDSTTIIPSANQVVARSKNTISTIIVNTRDGKDVGQPMLETLQKLVSL